MAVRLTADGEVDKRTKEYKDSQKKKFRWWKLPYYLNRKKKKRK